MYMYVGYKLNSSNRNQFTSLLIHIFKDHGIVSKLKSNIFFGAMIRKKHPLMTSLGVIYSCALLCMCVCGGGGGIWGAYNVTTLTS